ncbi:probable protein phosphatase 2C 74 [Ricinus communis]|uniref:Protein phosphatase 2c, putative n=1 Tax=Ricinus communis TaxID=3988 RepID=B9SHN9_RICCO|nr:probable protein phosphatase 2C 74 [Ricinus communis]EEF36866.1 protein phosphatase 2c, putative [Ricinus communis]|eukprot:XP_002525508.1 probable protein phosphatase 2C 74 [Ricinus communis]
MSFFYCKLIIKSVTYNSFFDPLFISITDFIVCPYFFSHLFFSLISPFEILCFFLNIFLCLHESNLPFCYFSISNSHATAPTRIFSKDMVHLEDLVWGFSLISLAVYLLQTLRKVIVMAPLCLTSPTSSSPSSSSSFSLPSPLSWVNQFVLEQQQEGVHNYFLKETGHSSCERKRKDLSDINLQEENKKLIQEEKIVQENMHFEAFQKGLHDKCYSLEESSLSVKKVGAVKLKKRPARLLVPEYCPKLEFGEKDKKLENKEFEVQGKDFFLASKKGRREVMEDGYGVMLDILGDSKQAFFAVIDGHGGRAAADFVAENLGKNIVKDLEFVGKEDDNYQPEQAIRRGYLTTDREFLSQGVSSGACAASVLLRDGELHVANVGDCRVVLSRKGVADTLTIDHRVSREDERLRIQNSGGFVHCRNGIWRVQGSLAISRAIGDVNLKEWVISEPEIKRVPLTSDCEFLIMASDGLWDKVNEQEAVDTVLRGRNSVDAACKKLVDMSFSRGNLDDITVMVINLQNFMANGS